MELSLSHADFVSGAVFLRLGGDDPWTRELVLAARTDPGSTDYKYSVLHMAYERYRSLLAHEWAHVLQVASYPYLFLRAARQGRIMSGVSTLLASNPGEYPIPLPFRLREDWAQSNVLSEIPVKVTVRKDGVHIEAVPPGTVARGLLTELDLVEEDAQIFQYRTEIGSRGNGAAYRRWLRESPRYSRLFLMMARHMGTEPAYRTLPLFVRLAFGTTRPLWAFFKCFALVNHNGPEILARWDTLETLESILLSHLRDYLGPADLGSVTMDQPEVADPQGLLPPEALATLLHRGGQLAVSPLTRIHVEGDGDEAPGAITRFLTQPWRCLPRNGDLPALAVTLMPPLLVIELLGDDFPLGSSVMAISPLLVKTNFADIPGVTYLDLAKEIYRARSVWKGIAAGAHGPHPRCPHAGCRVHRTGLCHAWFPIPQRAEDCGFPPFLRYTTKHRVADDGSCLVPVDLAPPDNDTGGTNGPHHRRPSS
ncbi:MAG TPA: hypothetical protein VF317_06605 [Dermatophilaceae bacterium]